MDHGPDVDEHLIERRGNVRRVDHLYSAQHLEADQALDPDGVAMRVPAPASALLLVLALSFLPGRNLIAQGERQIDGHWACQTIQADKTMYVSGVWDDNQLQIEVSTAWQQYLISKYQFKGQVNCSVAYKSGSTFAKIEGDQKNYWAQARAQGVKVIATGWTFVPSKVSLPYYCFGAVTVLNGGQKQSYF